MITINNLTVFYNKDKKVLENLNLPLDEGLIHGIVGLNGSGKTTFLNTIFGLKKPDSGTISIDNQGISKKIVSYLVTELAILGILKQDKPLMILDEPFNGLDIEAGRIIRLILLKLKERNKTIIITSHIIETLTNLCDFIHYLESGQINQSLDKSRFSEFEKEVFEKIENDHSAMIGELLK